MSLAKSRTRTSCSGVKCTNHEATLPPTDVGEGTLDVLGVASRVNCHFKVSHM